MLRAYRHLAPNLFFRNKTTVTYNSLAEKVLTPASVKFLEKLHNKHNNDYENIQKLRKGEYITDYRADTASIRDGDWSARKFSDTLKNRFVELTGPGNDAKMVINALNSSANSYMLDLEDSMSPSWTNVVKAHKNIYDLTRHQITAEKKDGNTIIKTYNQQHKLYDTESPLFFVRPRGLHMLETNFKVDGVPMSATLFDIGLHLFNNGVKLDEEKVGPYFYIPKLESYEDAIFVNDILNSIQTKLELPIGTSKVTVLVETFPAIFQTEEIIYALKDHIVGLNCGRWDYLFGMIKSLNTEKVLPYRNELTMDKPFMEAYVNQIVRSCNRRNIQPIGGMSAFIPTGDKIKDEKIIETIRKDKELEIKRGCTGAWVAHPGLIEPIKQVFLDNTVPVKNSDK